MVRCVCHRDRTPSLQIRDGDNGLLVHCFAGCDWRDIKNELKARGLLPEWKTNSWLTAFTKQSMVRKPPALEVPDERAIHIWRGTVEITGTPAECYLLSRNITLDITALRYHPSTTALVAPVQRIDGTVMAVQCLYLTHEGRKADVTPVRRTFGHMGDASVHLGAPTSILGLAEGVEDALSAMEISGGACWASLGGARMARLAIPDCVTTIHIFGDNDEQGRKFSEQARAAYELKGLEVVEKFPDGHKDWNEDLQCKGPYCAELVPYEY
jgi:putative DNA primase/helicase